MPRGSRHKLQKQSKHNSKDAGEYPDSEVDVKMKDRSSKEEVSVKVSKDSSTSSSEKRKLASQLRDSKDLSGHGNGDATEEHVSLKRRKEKVNGVDDRWHGGGDEPGDGGSVTTVKEVKRNSSNSKDSKVVGELKEETRGIAAQKDGSKNGSRVEWRRKSEKDSERRENQHKESKDLKENGRVPEKERKVNQDNKRDVELRAVNGEDKQEQGLELIDICNDSPDKKGRENSDWPLEDQLRNPELEKELERRIRKRRDVAVDKTRYHDGMGESDDRQLSSRSDRSKDGKRHKEEAHGDKYGKDDRPRNERYSEDGDKYLKHKDDKYRSEGESGHKNEKYQEERERETRQRKDKYNEHGSKDSRNRDDKYRDNGDRETRHKAEDGDREDRNKDSKYREDGSREGRRSDSRHRDGGKRDDRRDDDKSREDYVSENRQNEEKRQEDAGKDGKHGDSKHEDDPDRVKRHQDAKHREGRASREHADDSNAADVCHKKLSKRSPSYDDRSTRYKADQGRRKARDKEDHCDARSQSAKEQLYDAEKRSLSSVKPELVSDGGRHSSRYPDAEFNPNHTSRRNSPSLSSNPTGNHYRVSKREESKCKEYSYEERHRHNMISSRENDRISSPRTTEKPTRKDYSDLRKEVKETIPMDELSQPNGEAISVSSPFSRATPFSANSNSLLPQPPPPFRTGIPNWPSPLGNGFMNFQPHHGFHPMMQQHYPPPPSLFGLGPPMDLNQSSYHIPHGKIMGGIKSWQNHGENSYLAPLHSWDANNAFFVDESQVHGRRNQNGAMPSSRVWHRQNRDPVEQEEDHIEQKKPDFVEAKSEMNQSSKMIEVSNDVVLAEEEEEEEVAAHNGGEISEKDDDDDGGHCYFYIAKLDISSDLTQPELYEHCTSLMDMDESRVDDEGDSNILYVEEVAEASTMATNKRSSFSLFAAINDSVFQKAMSIYQKQRDDTKVVTVGVKPSVPASIHKEERKVETEEAETLPKNGEQIDNSNNNSNVSSSFSASSSVESIECVSSVHLSRIHHSPESTRC